MAVRLPRRWPLSQQITIEFRNIMRGTKLPSSHIAGGAGIRLQNAAVRSEQQWSRFRTCSRWHLMYPTPFVVVAVVVLAIFAASVNRNGMSTTPWYIYVTSGPRRPNRLYSSVRRVLSREDSKPVKNEKKRGLRKGNISTNTYLYTKYMFMPFVSHNTSNK